MKRFRNFDLRHSVMPFVLAALALRALLPAGFMPGSGDLSLTVQLCSPLKSGAVERIDVPGEPAAHEAHCDFCGLPLLGAPPVFAGVSVVASLAIEPRTTFTAQVFDRSPDRAPGARAPPA